MLAVHEGYLKMVQILEQHGADVNATDEDGDTPLHVSLMREKFFSAGMGMVTILTVTHCEPCQSVLIVTSHPNLTEKQILIIQSIVWTTNRVRLLRAEILA
jgi:L,D-peptidoglycan transpeptidase YkuD (ErfK/YbiS/YcfS/YnhG family)